MPANAVGSVVRISEEHAGIPDSIFGYENHIFLVCIYTFLHVFKKNLENFNDRLNINITDFCAIGNQEFKPLSDQLHGGIR